MLSAGKAIVFLDGLNEMGSDKIYKRNAIRNWLQAQSNPRYAIFTCRNSSYNNELDLGLPTATICKLETDAWIPIATDLINHLNKDNKSQINLEKFLNLIRSKEQLSRILSRPYFVELLVKIYVSGGSIPSTEALILNDFAQIVWKRERQQQPDLPDFSAMKTILGHLAFLLVSGQKFTVAYSEIVKESIGFFSRFFKSNEVSNLNTILKACTQADLLKNEGENYKFADEFFMDYFVACHMVDNPTKTPKLPEKDDIYIPQSWVKPVSYFYFLLPEEDEDLRNIIKILVTHNPCIATESVLVSDSRLKHSNFLVNNLLNSLEQKSSPSFKKALRMCCVKIGSESHNIIIQVIDDNQADLTSKHELNSPPLYSEPIEFLGLNPLSQFQISTPVLSRKATAIWLSGELGLKQAIPKLMAIIEEEKHLKTELNSLVTKRKQLKKQLRDERLAAGIATFGEAAVKFTGAVLSDVISNRPINMNNAVESAKKRDLPPIPVSYSTITEKERTINVVTSQIGIINYKINELIDGAKKALKTIRSVDKEQK